MKVTTKIKLRSLIRFLEDGDKAKITVRFRGRENGSPRYRFRRVRTR